MARRLAVSGHVLLNHDSIDYTLHDLHAHHRRQHHGHHQTFDKTIEQVDMLVQVLEQHVLFSHLDDEQLEEVIDVVSCGTISEGHDIVVEGTEGEAFYILEAGECDILVHGSKVGTVHPGQCFGELALLHDGTRKATVRSLTECKVWMLDRQTYQQRIQVSEMEKQELYQLFLSKVQILRGLSPIEQAKIAEVLEMQTFSAGEYIIRQGEAGDRFYIVESGELECTIEQEFGPAKVVKQLAEGDYFGELALKNKEPRAANVVAVTDCLLLSMDRESFDRLLGPVQDIASRRTADAHNVYERSQSSLLSGIHKLSALAAAASRHFTRFQYGRSIHQGAVRYGITLCVLAAILSTLVLPQSWLLLPNVIFVIIACVFPQVNLGKVNAWFLFPYTLFYGTLQHLTMVLFPVFGIDSTASWVKSVGLHGLVLRNLEDCQDSSPWFCARPYIWYSIIVWVVAMIMGLFTRLRLIYLQIKRERQHSGDTPLLKAKVQPKIRIDTEGGIDVIADGGPKAPTTLVDWLVLLLLNCAGYLAQLSVYALAIVAADAMHAVLFLVIIVFMLEPNVRRSGWVYMVAYISCIVVIVYAVAIDPVMAQLVCDIPGVNITGNYTPASNSSNLFDEELVSCPPLQYALRIFGVTKPGSMATPRSAEYLIYEIIHWAVLLLCGLQFKIYCSPKWKSKIADTYLFEHALNELHAESSPAVQLALPVPVETTEQSTFESTTAKGWNSLPDWFSRQTKGIVKIVIKHKICLYISYILSVSPDSFSIPMLHWRTVLFCLAELCMLDRSCGSFFVDCSLFLTAVPIQIHLAPSLVHLLGNTFILTFCLMAHVLSHDATKIISKV